MRPMLVLLFAQRARVRGARALRTRSRRWNSSTPRRCCTTTWSTNRRFAAVARPPTRLFGNAASVLVGDFVYSRAFQMMVSVDRMRVLEVLADATNVIAEGEVLQLMNMHDPDIGGRRLPARDPLQDRQAVRGQRADRCRAGRSRARASKNPAPPMAVRPGHGVPADRRPARLRRRDRRSSARTSATTCAKASRRLPLLARDGTGQCR